MSINKSISLLIVSALLVLLAEIAQAGDIDVQTDVRVTVGKNGGINIQSRPSGVNAIPHHRVPGPLRRQHWPKLYSKHNTWIKQTTVCNRRSYSHQSTRQLVGALSELKLLHLRGVSIVPIA